MSIRPLTPQLAEKAHKDFQEDPEKLQDALQQIKDWLASQPHIHARTDDQWLAAYIRGFQYQLEKVKTRLDLHYTCRHIAQEFYQMDHKNAKFKELMDSGFYLPLPKLSDPSAPRVTLIQPGTLNFLEFGAANALATTHVIDKIMIMDDDNAIIAGNIVILDLKGITNPLQFFQWNPVQMKILIAGHQDATPFHNFNTHIVINLPNELFVLSNIMKLFDDTRNHEKYYVYTDNYEDMYTKYGVSKEIMPTEYGGNGGTLKEIIDYWKQKVEEYSEWLEEDLQFGTDESKRPGEPKTAENMFGEFSLTTIIQFFELLA